MKKYDLNLTTCLFLGFLLVFFGLFLFYPVGLLLKGAFIDDGKFSLRFLACSSPARCNARRCSTASSSPSSPQPSPRCSRCRWRG